LYWVGKNMGAPLAPGGQGQLSVDPFKACFAESPWQQNYVNVAWGYVEELGFTEITPLRHATAKNLLHMILDPLFSPKYLLGGYFMGTRRFAPDCLQSEPFATWPEVIDSITKLELGNAQTRWAAGAGNAQGGYPTIALGASSFLVGVNDGPFAGIDALAWMKAHVANQGALHDNPMWAFLPRSSQAPSTGNSDPKPDWRKRGNLELSRSCN
jgi:hypothetical protein